MGVFSEIGARGAVAGIAVVAIAALVSGCYCSHRVVEDAGPPASDAGPPILRVDASRPDAGPADAGAPPELACGDDFDHTAEAQRLEDRIAELGFGPRAAVAWTGTIVERANDFLVIERDGDGALDRFVWSGHPLSECYLVGEQVQYGVREDGWHFVIGNALGFQSFIRPFVGAEAPPPFFGPDGEAVTMSFEPACVDITECGDPATQYALWIRPEWAPSTVASAGEEVDVPHGAARTYYVVHVGATDAPSACGERFPSFRGVVSVVSFETCVC